MEDYSLVQVVSLFLPDAHLQEECTKKDNPLRVVFCINPLKTDYFFL